MAEQHVREIQLGGKQLVFLFVASVGLAVVVFLLGVSVGRGVRERSGADATAADPVTAPVTAENMPPPTEITAEQQAILDTLAASAPQPGRTGPEASAEAIVTEPDAVEEPVDSDAEAPAAAVPDPTPETTPEPPPAAAPPPVARGEWSVQIGAYRSRATADREAAGLVDRGFSAYVDTTSGSGLFRVRIGPFEQRAQADEVAARLRQQGVQPLVIR